MSEQRRPGRLRLAWRLLLGLVLVAAAHHYFVGPSPGIRPFDTSLSGVRSSPFDALTGFERRQLKQQRAIVAELARRHVGSTPTGRSIEDLRILQEILDREVLAADQTRELQALGVALGDVMALRFGLDWVAFQDELGRSRALRLGETDVVIFPVTMISKRVEAGVPFDLDELWRKTERTIADARRGA